MSRFSVIFLNCSNLKVTGYYKMEKPFMLTDLLLHSIRANETVSGDWTALMWAAWYGELPVVKLLLQVPGIQVGIAHELLLRMRSLLLNYQGSR